MKTTLCVLAAFFAGFSKVGAQNETPAPAVETLSFNEGDNFLTLGFGFGNLLVTAFEADGVNGANEKKSITGPLFLKYEKALSPNVGFGLNLAMLQLKNDWTDPDVGSSGTGTYTGWSALARINYHIKPGKFFDPYLGFGMGYRSDRITETSTDPTHGKRFDRDITTIPFNLGMDVTLGFRMMFSNHIGIYMETGLAKGIVQLGLSGRF